MDRIPCNCAQPHLVTERLLVWSEEARRRGQPARAEALLLLAWEAYDRPRSACRHRAAARALSSCVEIQRA